MCATAEVLVLTSFGVMGLQVVFFVGCQVTMVFGVARCSVEIVLYASQMHTGFLGNMYNNMLSFP